MNLVTHASGVAVSQSLMTVSPASWKRSFFIEEQVKETAVPIYFHHTTLLSVHSLCVQRATNNGWVGSGVLKKKSESKVGGVITYVKQLSVVQSKENSTDSPHVPLSSSASCLKSLLSSSHFRVKDSDLNRFSLVSETKKNKNKKNI